METKIKGGITCTQDASVLRFVSADANVLQLLSLIPHR
jgi:hypothetical protein